MVALDAEEVDYRSLITMEVIKDVSGEIMFSCKDTLQYDMTKRIMKAITYEGSRIRSSFL
jgi:hypothetical protein